MTPGLFEHLMQQWRMDRQDADTEAAGRGQRVALDDMVDSGPLEQIVDSFFSSDPIAEMVSGLEQQAQSVEQYTDQMQAPLEQPQPEPQRPHEQQLMNQL